MKKLVSSARFFVVPVAALVFSMAASAQMIMGGGPDMSLDAKMLEERQARWFAERSYDRRQVVMDGVPDYGREKVPVSMNCSGTAFFADLGAFCVLAVAFKNPPLRREEREGPRRF